MSPPEQVNRRHSIASPDATDDFASAVIAGLSGSPKSLPSRLFYDAAGSALFEEITALPEYYPTRTEIAILHAEVHDIVRNVSAGTTLVEFGSGSSLKTEILLDAMPGVGVYVPIDVSQSALDQAVFRLAGRFPDLNVHPITADFTAPLRMPEAISASPKIGFFPGSTIGNATPNMAVTWLQNFATTLGKGACLIVGVDLKKDSRRLVRAYADEAGVTAKFNLNLLVRINERFGPVFDLADFRHSAIYDPIEGRIEMHLVCLKSQTVRLADRVVHFREGETIHTENSYKYTVAEFQSLAKTAGWNATRVWVDAERLFSVHELTAAAR